MDNSSIKGRAIDSLDKLTAGLLPGKPLPRFLVTVAPVPGQSAPEKQLVRLVDRDLGERNDPAAVVAGFQTDPKDLAVQRLIPGSEQAVKIREDPEIERGGGGIVELHLARSWRIVRSRSRCASGVRVSPARKPLVEAPRGVSPVRREPLQTRTEASSAATTSSIHHAWAKPPCNPGRG